METKIKRGRSDNNTAQFSNSTSTDNAKPKPKKGAPKGSRNAAKPGRDLKYQLYMSKVRRGFFEEYFELKFGRSALNDDELREVARQIAEEAINHAMVTEFERAEPGRTTRGLSEVF